MNRGTILNINFKYVKLVVNNLLNLIGKIILSMLFIIIILPIALLLKSFGYDPLKKRINRYSQKSYREKILKTKKDFKSTS